MSILIGFLYVVEVIVCLLLALAVMLQKPKEGGLGGAIGGGMGEAVFGADASNVLIKVTIWLGAIFLANTLLLARLTSVGHSQSVMGDVSAPKPAAEQPAAPSAGRRIMWWPGKPPAASLPRPRPWGLPSLRPLLLLRSLSPQHLLLRRLRSLRHPRPRLRRKSKGNLVVS